MELIELGKAPIAGDSPVGEDIRYDPTYDELQTEIGKLSDATSGGVIDWKRVIEMSTDILSNKSKDLLVTVYLAEALVQTENFDGMMTGSTILRDLVVTYWDGMFPAKKRKRGRINAISWWLDHMNAFTENYHGDELPHDTVATITDNVNALDEALSAGYDDMPPLLPLLNRLGNLPVSAPPPPPEPEPAPQEAATEGADSAPAEASTTATPSAPARPSTPAPAAAPASAPAESAGPIASDSDADHAAAEALGRLVDVAQYYLNKIPASPSPYRLIRLAAWMPVKGLPPAEDGKTMLPPPEAAVLSSIKTLLSSGNFQGALEASESRITQYRFWLDLTRLSAQALENMGPVFAPALNGIKIETMLYVERLKGVENLSFNDGTPFADADTKAWLKTLSLANGDAATPSGGDDLEQSVAEGFNEAKKLLRSQKGPEALALLQAKRAAGASGRERLLWTINVARALFLLGQNSLAGPLLDEIVEVIDAHDLERFDPALALRGLLAVHEGVSAGQDDEAKTKTVSVLMRITKIAPAEAIKIGFPT